HGAFIVGIRPVTGLAEPQDVDSVGQQHRRVDPVERGPRHRPQNAQGAVLNHGFPYAAPFTWPGLRSIDNPTAPRTRKMSYQPRSDFLRVIIERGFLADCTDLQGLDEALMAGIVPAYIGYD